MAYELSAGYVLGVVTALALALLGPLLQGRDGDLFVDVPWVRWVAIGGLAVVVFAGVLPVYRHLEAERRR